MIVADTVEIILGNPIIIDLWPFILLTFCSAIFPALVYHLGLAIPLRLFFPVDSVVLQHLDARPQSIHYNWIGGKMNTSRVSFAELLSSTLRTNFSCDSPTRSSVCDPHLPPQIYDNLQELGETSPTFNWCTIWAFENVGRTIISLPSLKPFQLPLDLIAPAAQFVDDFFFKWFSLESDCCVLFVIETNTRPRDTVRKTTAREWRNKYRNGWFSWSGKCCNRIRFFHLQVFLTILLMSMK